MKKLPKIGKRGWLGVILFAMGLMNFIGAHSSAEQESDELSIDPVAAATGDFAAQEEGYDSYTDFRAHDFREGGVGLIAVGSVLVLWGYMKYGDKKTDDKHDLKSAGSQL